jgi:hypothetical protein
MGRVIFLVLQLKKLKKRQVNKECFQAYRLYQLTLYLGLQIKEDELIDMTEMAYGDKWRGVYPSAGGSGIRKASAKYS